MWGERERAGGGGEEEEEELEEDKEDKWWHPRSLVGRQLARTDTQRRLRGMRMCQRHGKVAVRNCSSTGSMISVCPDL